MRQALAPLRLVVAMLIVMLAAGRGLPVLAQMLSGSSSHVCTCASGGSHSACPVCNPSLIEPRQARAPVVHSAPCGEHRSGIEGAGQPSTLPPALVSVGPAVARLPAFRAGAGVVQDAVFEPATPPPRRG